MQCMHTLVGRNESEDYSTSLCHIVRHNPVVYNKGKEHIETHLAMNTTFDTKKAHAIQVFVTAIDKWGNSILEAAQKASDVTGNSAYSIRQWAFSFFTAIGGTDQEVDSEFVYHELSSNRGCASGNQSYIIHNEPQSSRLRALPCNR